MDGELEPARGGELGRACNVSEARVKPALKVTVGGQGGGAGGACRGMGRRVRQKRFGGQRGEPTLGLCPQQKQPPLLAPSLLFEAGMLRATPNTSAAGEQDQHHPATAAHQCHCRRAQLQDNGPALTVKKCGKAREYKHPQPATACLSR